MTTDQLDKAIAEHGEAVLAEPGVSGVYRSQNEAGEPCIKIIVVKRGPEIESLVEERFPGLPVVYSESGPIEPK